MDKYLNKILTWLFVLGFVCIITAGAMVSYPKVVHSKGLAAEHARILKRIEDKTREIAEIRAKQQRFNNDREFVENLARQNRRVFPGELVFVFDD